MLHRLTIFPFVIAAAGIVAAILAQAFVRMKTWENPQKALNIATYVATIIEIITSLIASLWLFGSVSQFFSVSGWSCCRHAAGKNRGILHFG